jgi:hypothetical protein
MAIIIPHRFLGRLTSTEGYGEINTIIIGTFNPGHPVISKLNATELKQFREIRISKD